VLSREGIANMPIDEGDKRSKVDEGSKGERRKLRE
jgi:hypothetical protein